MGKTGIAFVAFLAAAEPAWAQDFTWPTTGTVTQTFHDTFSGKSSGWYYGHDHALHYFDYAGGAGFHRAIDIGAPTGTAVVASRTGTALAFPDTGGGYGNHIVIDHGGGYFTLYGHLSVIAVSDGQAVATGDYIGQVGATGNVTGPHLHFEVRYSSTGEAWNYSIPRYYIPSTDGDAIAPGITIWFDYPGIGASGGGVPGPAPAPAGPALPDRRNNPNGDRSINDQCAASVTGAGSAPTTFGALAAALLGLGIRRRRR